MPWQDLQQDGNQTRISTVLLISLNGTQLMQTAGAAKILLLPFYHNSHVNMFLVAGKSLQKAGKYLNQLLK